MKSILDRSVSCFKDYSTPVSPHTVNLLAWLNSTKYKDIVENIRATVNKTERDKLKSALPAITPSGEFSYRSQDKLIQHSGLIQFDIDWKENSHVANFEELKDQISNLSNVAYCGLSVSGKGYWGLIPIKHPERQKSHFRAIHKAFKHYGLNIDTTPQNVASPRCYSIDPEAYFNHNANVFHYLYKPPKRKIERTHYDSDTRSEVESLIEKIQSKRIDITKGYDQWLRIGFALADEFGVAGRDYYHAVSQYYPEYREKETDRQFDHCLQSKGEGVTIATFFYLCKAYGIEFTENGCNSSLKDRVSVVKLKSEKSADKNGYPPEWDEILPPEPGTPEDIEVIQHVIKDVSTSELKQMMELEPILYKIVQNLDYKLST